MSGQNRCKPPAAIDIALYWDSMQWDHKTKSVPKLDDGTEYPSLTDWGEPSCMGCGCWNEGWDIGEYKKGDFEHNEKTANNRWERSGLEKAHIIPWSLGGANKPFNFLMLCRHCHFDFDNEVLTLEVKDLGKVFKWLKDRPEQKNNILMNIFDNYAEDKSYDQECFIKCIAVAWAKVSVGREKSLVKHAHRVLEAADAAYIVRKGIY